MKFCGSAPMREMDRYTIEELGIPGETLMFRAASGAADAAQNLLGAAPKRVLVLCGSGNNGGDGIGIASLLLKIGHNVTCIMVGQVEKLSSDSHAMLNRLQAAGGQLACDCSPDIVYQDWDLLVDALLGTGLSRAVSGTYAAWIAAVNQSGHMVLACDIASGISADTGDVMGCAVHADLTVTFNLPKTGQLLPPGTEYTGKLLVHDIGIPQEAIQRVHLKGSYVTSDMVASWLPSRRLESHKGDCGKLLLLCGSTGLTGAAALSARAALRTGAGLVYLGVPESVYPILAAKLDEPVIFPLPADLNGRFSDDCIPEVLNRLKTVDACLVGPGIGRSCGTAQLVRRILAAASCPVVLDADGINVLEGDMDFLKNTAASVVLTPHEGEFLRMGGSLSDGRIAAACTAAENLQNTVVLKGYRTVTAGPNGDIYVNSSGNPGMACGGSGDVLSGILVCLLGQKMEPERAAAAAVWLHGAAGDLCRDRLGERSMLPSDLINALPELLK